MTELASDAAKETKAAKRQSPLKVDPDVDELISHGAHFLGMSKKDFVAEASKAYLEQRREEVRAKMLESMKKLDGSLASAVTLLTGLSAERINELGGVGDWEDWGEGDAANIEVSERRSPPGDSKRSRTA